MFVDLPCGTSAWADPLFHSRGNGKKVLLVGNLAQDLGLDLNRLRNQVELGHSPRR